MSKNKLNAIIAICSCSIFLFGILSYFTSKILSALLFPIVMTNNQIITVKDLENKDSLPKFKSYDELYNVLKNLNVVYNNNGLSLFGANKSAKNEMAVADSAEARQSAATAAPASDSSSTNVQVQGVDEGDILKNDGKYIYVVSKNNTVKIINPIPSNAMKIVSTIALNDNENINEMYVKNSKIILIGTSYEVIKSSGSGSGNAATGTAKPSIAADSKMIAPDIYYGGEQKTFAKVYDISKIDAPALYRQVTLDGNCISSREKDGNIYLISNKWIYNMSADNTKPELVLPKYSDSAVKIENKVISAESISYCPGNINSNFLITAVFNMNDKNEATIETVFGSGSNIYMNTDNLYITYASYNYQTNMPTVKATTDAAVSNEITASSESSSTVAQAQNSTIILKFAVLENGIKYIKTGEVDGTILNQFSMDEFDGYFRIATNSFRGSVTDNNLYVLNNELKTVGKLEGLAKGERIYSVRFSGKTGYVVTFRNMDPLFVIDLSDPTKPMVSGELKIPGFSNYMQPVGDGRLLGIGQDTAEQIVKQSDGKEVVTGNVRGGIKLSLFDVSDPKNPKEIDKLILGGSGSSTEVQYNHKALTYNANKGLAFFPVYLYGEDGSYQYQYDIVQNYLQGAAAVAVTKDKLTLKGKLTPDLNNQTYYTGSRLCYIDNNLYFLFNGKLISYNMDTLAQVQDISLN